MSLLIKETQLQRIIRKTGRKPVQCKCRLCKFTLQMLIFVQIVMVNQKIMLNGKKLEKEYRIFL